MAKRKSTAVFSFVAAGLFLAVLLFPGSPAQLQSTLEGEGMTNNATKIAQKTTFTFSQYSSLDSSSGSFISESDDVSFSTIESSEEVTTSATLSQPLIISLPGGLDHAAFGTATRNSGSGSIRVRGVPAGSTVVRAFLYWGTIVTNPAPTTATACLNGTQLNGRLIGTSAEPCWLIPNAVFAAYRASVRTLIPPAINGVYAVNCLATSVTDSRDPFTCTLPFTPPTPPVSEGASLVILFANKFVPSTARTYIHQGPFTVTGQVDIPHNLSPVLPSFTQLKHTRVGADGQVGCSLFSSGLPSSEQTLIGGSLASLTLMKGTASLLNSDSDWNGDDGVPMNQLWDTHTDAFQLGKNGPGLPSMPMLAGAAQYFIRYASVNDCFVPVVHVLTAK